MSIRDQVIQPAQVIGAGGSGGGGATGPTGPTGPEGPQGPTGATGAAGADGRTWLSGAGAPDSGLGVDGDFYLDTSASAYYGPKTAGSWGSPTSLVGPAGDEGPAGPAPSGGTDGQFIKRMSGAPAWATPAIADTTGLQAALDGKAATSHTHASPFAPTGGSGLTTADYISTGPSYGGISGGSAVVNAGSGARCAMLINGVEQMSIQGKGLVFSRGENGSPAEGAGAVFMQRSTSNVLYSSVPAGASHQWAFQSGAAAMTLSSSGLSIGSTNFTGLNYNGVGSVGFLAAGAASRAMMGVSNSSAGAHVYCRGITDAETGAFGQLELCAVAVSLANGATRLIRSTAASRLGGVRLMDATNTRQAVFDVEGTTITKIRGHAQFVSGTPGAGEVGLRVASGNLVIDNNSGGALLLADIYDGI